MKYRLVAIDMDGTLLNSQHQVSHRTRSAIEKAKEKGVHIILSTGRVLKSALSYSKELELKNPIIACNGAIIVDEDTNIIYKKPMDMNKVTEIVKLAMAKDIYYHFYDESKFYSHIRVEEVLKFYNESNGSEVVDINVFEDIDNFMKSEDINVYKFIFLDHDRNKLNLLRDELDELENISTSSSWSNNIEAMSFNVSKGEAVRELCHRLQISPDEVIAIGDSENDLSMIKFAGLGVAMGNGDEAIKAQADYVTDTNDEDGVAKIIEKFVLE